MHASPHISTDRWRATIDQLEQITRNFGPGYPVALRTQIITALGEVGSIWPDSVREKVAS